jgi:membrane fusion protein (multidrug efflux system)
MGTTVDIELCVEEKGNSLIIPFEAVFFQDGQTTVYKIENEQVVSCLVKLGIRYKENVEIVEGLQAGDIIVIRGQSRLYPSMNVEVQRVDTAQ